MDLEGAFLDLEGALLHNLPKVDIMASLVPLVPLVPGSYVPVHRVF